SGLIPQAIEKLTAAIEKVPQEPAAWANRGLAYLRQARPDLDKSKADLDQAHRLAPDNADIEEMLGHLAEERGKLDEAIAHFRKASQADPDDVRRLYKLNELIEAEDREGADAERARLIDEILRRRPTNLHLLALRIQLALRQGDKAAVR